MIYENCRDGFDRAPVQNVNDFAAAAVPIPHRLRKEPRCRVLVSQGSVLRALALASLCVLAAFPALAVNQASNLKLSPNGDKVVLTWTGAPGVLYQVQGATSLGGRRACKNIDAPTTSSCLPSIRTSPSEFDRGRVFT